MKKYALMAVSAIGLALAACTPEVEAININDANTGEMLDQVVIVNSADNFLTPGVKVVGKMNGSKFEPYEVAAAGSPLEQLSPMGAAAIDGVAQIEAAKNIRPDITNVNATGGAANATGGNAYSHAYSYAHGGLQYQVQSQQQLSSNQVRNYVKNNVTQITCAGNKVSGVFVKRVSGC